MKTNKDEAELADIKNLYLNNKGHLRKRAGYSSFISLIKMLYRINRSNKRFQFKARYEITLPIKWF